MGCQYVSADQARQHAVKMHGIDRPFENGGFELRNQCTPSVQKRSTHHRYAKYLYGRMKLHLAFAISQVVDEDDHLV
jgi:hypothetical protein